MKYVFTAFMAIAALVFLAGPAMADWYPGDDYKMHYPQLPNPNGLDVNFTDPKVLADDWLCTESGPVSDIHFWFSSKYDLEVQFQIQNIHVSIHDNLAVGDPNNPYPYSIPSTDPLWQRDFAPPYRIVGPFSGQQGWWDPNLQEDGPPHFLFWEVNLTGIQRPFEQKADTIYWLDLSLKAIGPTGGPVELGWKTSIEKPFMDRPVFRDMDVAGMPWTPVWGVPGEYATGPDLAFVITPEPGTVAMLIGAGLIGLVAYARRRRKG